MPKIAKVGPFGRFYYPFGCKIFKYSRGNSLATLKYFNKSHETKKRVVESPTEEGHGRKNLLEEGHIRKTETNNEFLYSQW